MIDTQRLRRAFSHGDAARLGAILCSENFFARRESVVDSTQPQLIEKASLWNPWNNCQSRQLTSQRPSVRACFDSCDPTIEYPINLAMLFFAVRDAYTFNKCSIPPISMAPCIIKIISNGYTGIAQALCRSYTSAQMSSVHPFSAGFLLCRPSWQSFMPHLLKNWRDVEDIYWWKGDKRRFTSTLLFTLLSTTRSRPSGASNQPCMWCFSDRFNAEFGYVAWVFSSLTPDKLVKDKDERAVSDLQDKVGVPENFRNSVLALLKSCSGQGTTHQWSIFCNPVAILSLTS